jgi:hypothetical protein
LAKMQQEIQVKILLAEKMQEAAKTSAMVLA